MPPFCLRDATKYLLSLFTSLHEFYAKLFSISTSASTVSRTVSCHPLNSLNPSTSFADDVSSTASGFPWSLYCSGLAGNAGRRDLSAGRCSARKTVAYQ